MTFRLGFSLAVLLLASPALAVPQGTPNANGIGALAIANALSELVTAGSQAAARANLGLGTLATLSTLSGLDAPSGGSLGFRVAGTSIGSATASGWSFLQPITMAAFTSIGFASGSNKYSLYGDGSNTLLNTPAGGAISFRNGGTETGYALSSGWVFKQPLRLPSYTVAALPTCNASLQDYSAVVTDATSPTYRGALTGGGTVRTPVYCDGSVWSAH